MLDSLLLIRLLLAFAVGSIWVAAITVITERKGTTWGILGGLPSTAAFSLFFIGINQSAAAAVDATVVLPLIFSVSNAFLLLYAVSARKGFVFGLCVSLLVWFVVSAVIVWVGFSDYAVSLAVGAAISVLTFLAFRRLRTASLRRSRQTVWQKRNPHPRRRRRHLSSSLSVTQPNRRTNPRRCRSSIPRRLHLNHNNPKTQQRNRILPFND